MKHIKTTGEFRRFINLPAPQHPLISVIDVKTVPHADSEKPVNLLPDFYSIAVKRMYNVKMKWGQQLFDFNEGNGPIVL